jgi:hypothetical protein
MTISVLQIADQKKQAREIKKEKKEAVEANPVTAEDKKAPESKVIRLHILLNKKLSSQS